jgi:hypothetical protein
MLATVHIGTSIHVYTDIHTTYLFSIFGGNLFICSKLFRKLVGFETPSISKLASVTLVLACLQERFFFDWDAGWG